MSGVAPLEQLQREMDTIIEQGIVEHIFPGASLWVGWHGKTLKCSAYGQTADQAYVSYQPLPVTTSTLYDLASLTKMATTFAIMQLIEQGLLRLDDPLSRYLPQLRTQQANITIQHVLTHTSGLPGPCRLYLTCRGPEQILQGIYAQELAFPPGTQCQYSDLGYILLGEIIHRITSLRLDAYTRKYLFEPLEMHDTLFIPPGSLKKRIAPTEYVDWRGGLVHGIVHDENAWQMQGIAGQAGLFSTAEDLGRFCTMVLQRGYYGSSQILQESTLRMMESIYVTDPDEPRGLGWTVAAPYFMGQLAANSTVGHTGFTGTSLLIDPMRQFALVFLTNCICPRRGPNLNPYRRGLANALARLL
jgi:CubicO group peptidase (beta-lactamase class C family)